METGSIIETCFFCEQEFAFGPHRYDGKVTGQYNLVACNTCLSGNSDGVGPAYEEKFLKYLKSEGITLPDRNEKGLLKL